MLISQHFGIHPWDYERLTIDEFYGYCRAAEILNEKPE